MASSWHSFPESAAGPHGATIRKNGDRATLSVCATSTTSPTSLTSGGTSRRWRCRQRARAKNSRTASSCWRARARWSGWPWSATDTESSVTSADAASISSPPTFSSSLEGADESAPFADPGPRGRARYRRGGLRPTVRRDRVGPARLGWASAGRGGGVATRAGVPPRPARKWSDPDRSGRLARAGPRRSCGRQPGLCGQAGDAHGKGTHHGPSLAPSRPHRSPLARGDLPA